MENENYDESRDGRSLINDAINGDTNDAKCESQTIKGFEANQKRVNVFGANDSGLLRAVWRSPDKVHQIGIMDRKSGRFINIPVKDVNDAMTRAKELSDAGFDVYYAPAEYSTPDNRTASNAAGACALWIDADIGESKYKNGKGYRTTEDALKATNNFCAAARLPLPTHIVNSGSGLHIYWVLEEFVEREDWIMYANKLKALTKHFGFLADPTRTADIASVLRIPGTLNHKYEPPLPVFLIYESTK